MKNRKSTTSFASYRLFKLLKYLSENKASVKDIVNYLESIDPENRTYSIITVYKYLNTIKALNINLIKNDKNKYTLEKSPFTFNFSENVCLALKILEKYSDYIEEEKLKNKLSSFIKTLEKSFDTETLSCYKNLKVENLNLKRSYSDEELNLIKTFEKCIEDNLKICISYRENKNTVKRLLATPVEIEYYDSKVYFIVYDSTKGQNLFLEIEKIVNIEQLPQKALNSSIVVTAMYEIKGRLKKRYVLKKYENLYSSSEDKSVIVNKGEDREKFVRRLIGYCDLCKIISPKSYKKDMIAELDMMIKNYE